MTKRCEKCGAKIEIKAGIESQCTFVQKAVGLVSVADLQSGEPDHGHTVTEDYVCEECLYPA